METNKFRAEVANLVNSTDEVSDEEFWDRVSGWSLDVLAARARTKRVERLGGVQVNIAGDNHAPISL